MNADFNGDQRDDIVHIVANTDYVHVWTSNGNGTFGVGTFRPWAGYAMPNGLWRTGDFNGDGRADLIHLVANSDYAHVWTSNGNGTFNVGTFRPWAGYAIPNGDWVVGDFNGDGRSDLVHVVRNTDYVHVWTSNGNGTFAVGTFRPWAGYAMPNGLWLAGDFNDDGRDDLVHVVANTDYVHVWTSNGNGTFAVGTFRPWAGYAMPNGLWRTGDFNGDGKTDLVHAVQNSDYVHIWTSRGNGTFDVGTFRPWAGYAIPNGVWLANDFDGDGRTDLVHAVRNTDYVHIWRSTGYQSFNVSTFSPWSGYAIPNGIWLSGDLTGDGKADILHAVRNTDYVHPWLSTLPGPGEVAVAGLEVVQAVQNVQNAVRLVGNKGTVVRAYLDAGGTVPMIVRGTLLVWRWPFGPTTTINSTGFTVVNPSQNNMIRPKRENTNGGLTFILPPGLTGSAWYLYRVLNVTNVFGGASVNCTDCNTRPRVSRIGPATPLRLRVIGLRYQTGTPPTSYAPRVLDFNLIRSWLRRAYPIGQLLFSSVTVNASNTWPFTCGQANAQIAAIRTQDVNSGTDRRTHYFGLVSDGGGFMRGCSAGIPNNANPAVVASGPTGSATYGWDTDGSYGDWYTGHELGHTLGRRHIGSGCGETSDDPSYPFPNGQISDADGAFVGYDVGDAAQTISRAALPGVDWHDVMSYCDNQWLSSYTYESIHARLTAENALPAGAPPPGAPSPGPPAAGPGPDNAGAMPIAAAPKDTVLTLGAESPLIEEIKPAMAEPPTPVLGYKEPPAVRTGRSSKMITFADQKPDLPYPDIWGRPRFPQAELPGPPEIRKGLSDLALESGSYLLNLKPKPMPEAIEPEHSEARQTRDSISVVATVNLTRLTGKIEYASRVSRGAPVEKNQETFAAVRLTDAAGEVLGEYPVPVMLDTDVPRDEDRTGLVDAIVPYPPTVAAIELLLAGETVDRLTISKSEPVGGELKVLREEKGGFTLRWEAYDPDGDSLRYHVQTSDDDGVSWQTVAFDLSEPTFRLDPALVRESKNLLVRIIATDGFNSTTFGVQAVRSNR